MNSIPDKYIQFANKVVDMAGEISLRHFRSGIESDLKLDRSPVTIADKEIEELMASMIKTEFPSHSILGEELGFQEYGEEWCWTIDPIDGTKSFATGNPMYGILLSLLHEGEPVLGISDHPALGERWVGITGCPTTKNELPCKTSKIQLVNEATVYTTTIDMFDGDSLRQYSLLANESKFRVFGGDCYCYGLLASGFTDVVCEGDMKPYDYFPLIPIVEGSGGSFTDWHGAPLTMDSGDKVIASANETLHASIVEIINGE